MTVELPKTSPVPAAAAARAIKWSRDPKVRAEQARHPAGWSPPPKGHRISSTTHTVKRETTTRPAPKQPSLIQMTPAQIADRAKRIVNAEVASERLPFQQRETAIAGERTSTLAGHAADYGKLEQQTAAAADQNAASAKTFQNTAAEQVKRVEEQNPITGAEGSQLRKQQEATRTELLGIANAAQGATATRAAAGANLMGAFRADAAAQNAAGAGRISGEYGRRDQEARNQEAQIVSGKPGRVGKLILGMQGEQEKLRIASAGLNIKGAEAERHTAETRSNITNRREATAINKQKLANEGRKITADENYKNASLGSKRTKDALDIKKKEIDIKKALEGPNASGKALTRAQVNSYTGEFSRAFNFLKRAREEGADPAEIQKELESGQGRRSYDAVNPKTKKKETKHFTEKFSAVKNPVFIQAGIDIMQKEYVSAPVKAQLRELGITDTGWSERFLGKRPTAVGQSHSRNKKKRG